MFVGGCRQREPRHRRKSVEQRPEQAVVRAKIMPPFGHAMRLVDREQRGRARRHQRPEAFAGGPPGRDVEKVELTAAIRLPRFGEIGIAAGQPRGANPRSEERRGGTVWYSPCRSRWWPAH